MTATPVAGHGEEALSDAVLAEASDWRLRIQDAPDDLDLRARFDTWLESDAAHRNAWALLERSVRLTLQTPPAHVADWRTAGPDLPPVPVAADRKAKRRGSHALSTGPRIARRVALGGVAAALVAVLSGPQVMIQLRADETSGTARNRALALADGSRIALGAQSAITQDFAGRHRRIGLLQGEAFFDVAHDTARPFTVQAADMTVTVTGTAFDVGMTRETLDVSVARGSVRVERPGARPLTVALRPGQRLTIDRETGRNGVVAVSPFEIGAWRSGRLAVRNTSIAEVTELLGRHFPGHIFVRDDVLKSARVTGVYDLADPVGSLRTLLSSGGARMTRITPWIIIVTPA
ncbi:MAG: FecR domain-containing protein [Novosphingobium sp.]|nr:FecR domain-containing protein [Novosphingobium sp.]